MEVGGGVEMNGCVGFIGCCQGGKIVDESFQGQTKITPNRVEWRTTTLGKAFQYGRRTSRVPLQDMCLLDPSPCLEQSHPRPQRESGAVRPFSQKTRRRSINHEIGKFFFFLILKANASHFHTAQKVRMHIFCSSATYLHSFGTASNRRIGNGWMKFSLCQIIV